MRCPFQTHFAALAKSRANFDGLRRANAVVEKKRANAFCPAAANRNLSKYLKSSFFGGNEKAEAEEEHHSSTLLRTESVATSCMLHWGFNGEPCCLLSPPDTYNYLSHLLRTLFAPERFFVPSTEIRAVSPRGVANAPFHCPNNLHTAINHSAQSRRQPLCPRRSVDVVQRRRRRLHACGNCRCPSHSLIASGFCAR